MCIQTADFSTQPSGNANHGVSVSSTSAVTVEEGAGTGLSFGTVMESLVMLQLLALPSLPEPFVFPHLHLSCTPASTVGHRGCHKGVLGLI